jgi:hypothetical protein
MFASTIEFENPTIILKSYIKENYDSNKTYRYVHDLSLLNFIHLHVTVHELSPKKQGISVSWAKFEPRSSQI